MLLDANENMCLFLCSGIETAAVFLYVWHVLYLVLLRNIALRSRNIGMYVLHAASRYKAVKAHGILLALLKEERKRRERKRKLL